MSKPLEIEDVLRLFPHHKITFAPDGSQQLRLECTGRVFPIAVVDDFKKTSRMKGAHSEVVAFLKTLTSEQRVCDGCRKADKGMECKLASDGGRCALCVKYGWACSLLDRLRMDILCQRYQLSSREATELYRPFVTGRTDLDSPFFPGSDVPYTVNGRPSTDADEQASSSPPRPTSVHQSNSRLTTSTRLHPPASLARANAGVRFRDIDEGDESSSPTGLPSGIGPAKRRTSSTVRTARRGNQGRPPSSIAARRRPRFNSQTDSSDTEYLPAPRSSRSSTSKGEPPSIEDQLEALKHKVEDWKEKALIAQDEVESMRDLAAHYEGRSNVLKEQLAQDRKDRLVQQELAMVQESSIELEPAGIRLPTLAMWMMNESASLAALHRSLSSASVPESPDEPVSLSRDAYSDALALIDNQHEGLNNWLAGHLPGFQHLVHNTAQEGALAPSEARYRRIEDAARVAREELELKRAIEENRVAAEERRQQEIEKKARQEALCAKLAETREAARIAKEAQDKLQAELLNLGVEIPPGPSL